MKKETMLAIAKNLTDLSKLFAEAAGETESSQAEENLDPMPDIKLEDIRAILAEKSQAGKTKDIRNLLDSIGAEKLSDVDPAYFSKLLEEARAL